MPRKPGVTATSPTGIVTFLFTDIEGSTRLWEQEPERMQPGAGAARRTAPRDAVDGHRGTVVKMTGDGIYAAFDDPLDALARDAGAAAGARRSARHRRRARCGCAADCTRASSSAATTTSSARAVNRTARIMSAAHGGQVLLSQAVADRCRATACRRVSRCATWARCGCAICESRARLPGGASATAAGLSGAALAGSDAEQPAAAGDLVHRPRARAGRGQGAARPDRGC